MSLSDTAINTRNQIATSGHIYIVDVLNLFYRMYIYPLVLTISNECLKGRNKITFLRLFVIIYLYMASFISGFIRNSVVFMSEYNACLPK